MKEESRRVIYLIHDEEPTRQRIKRMIRSAGMDVRTFATTREFLDYDYENQNTCLLVQVERSGHTGLELQKKLVKQGEHLPVIFITPFYSKEIRDQTKKAGAVGYLKEPVDDQALLDMIQWALTGKRKRGRNIRS